MRRESALCLGLAALAALAGCAGVPEQSDDLAGSATPRSVTAFSLAQPDGVLPGAWRPWRLSRLKKLTSYRLIDYNGSVVVKAMSAASASGLVHPLDIDPREFPVLQWRWKVPALIAGANNSRRNAEDAPVRVVLSFDGDTESLPLEDRVFFDRIRALTGYELPYATLMYIWENQAPAGTVIANPHSTRIQMVVAESGSARTGTWKLESQNVYEDYKRAFGAEPGRIKAIAIMTDTDNTGTSVEAYYGDIAFMSVEDAQRVSLAPRGRGGQGMASEK
jgi:Protein of unknown function (DUF3047)